MLMQDAVNYCTIKADARSMLMQDISLATMSCNAHARHARAEKAIFDTYMEYSYL